MTRTQLVGMLEREANEAMKNFKRWNKVGQSEKARIAATEYSAKREFIARLNALTSLS